MTAALDWWVGHHEETTGEWAIDEVKYLKSTIAHESVTRLIIAFHYSLRSFASAKTFGGGKNECACFIYALVSEL